MRVLIAALLLSISTTALADNIAGCEVVLMEKIAQEGLEGSAEVASFRPAADFITSIYDEEIEVLREIDGLPIRAIMCKRKSVVPSLRDFPIVATGTPFMISQNFDSSETGLTTIYFKDGKFRSSYKGADLDAETEAKMKDRLEVFNLQPHDLAEKEKAMQKKSGSSTDRDPELDKVASEDELIGVSKETSKTDNVASEDELIGATKDTTEKSTEDSPVKDDTPSESAEEDKAPVKKPMEKISSEEHEEAK